MLGQLKRRVLKPAVRPLARLYAKFNRSLFTTDLIDPASPRAYELISYGRHSVQDPEGLLGRRAEPVTDRWGGRNPTFYNYEPSQISAASLITVFRGTPGIRTFHDVVYSPQHECLYTADGVRVNESCLYRGCPKEMVNKAPERVGLWRDLKRFPQTLIYVGGFHKHYGHFLTEGIARYWYAVADEGHPILSHRIDRYSPKALFLDRFFEAVSFPRQRLVTFQRPVLLKEVIVPLPSFTNASEGFEVHRLIPESVAAKVLSDPSRRTAQPLYMSRRHLGRNNRLVINEEILEDKLRARGFEIVYPERLSLDQQIKLINQHEVVVGTVGSALHGSLFDLSPERSRNIICLAYKDMIHPNYLLIDAIKSVNSTYIGALEFAPGGVHVKNYAERDRILDLDSTFATLKQIGLW
jgi:capsular polysaccharide biosynthesis protein